MEAGVVHLVKRTENQLCGEGITRAAAEILVIVGDIGPFLLSCDDLREGTCGEPEPIL